MAHVPTLTRRSAWNLACWALIALAALAVWTLAARATAAEATAPALARGPDLFQQNCASCHGPDGGGTSRGPTLVGVGAASADYWVRSGRMPLAEPDQRPYRGLANDVIPFRGRVEPAQTGAPANRWTPLTDAQIDELVAYVASLGDGPGIPSVDPARADVARGGELYRLNCAACHNWDGKGGALVGGANAPGLTQVPAEQVAEAMRVGPAAMPLFSPGLLSDQELNDVVAYVATFRAPEDAGGWGLGHWGPATEGLAGVAGLVVLLLVTAWLGKRTGRAEEHG